MKFHLRAKQQIKLQVQSFSVECLLQLHG